MYNRIIVGKTIPVTDGSPIPFPGNSAVFLPDWSDRYESHLGLSTNIVIRFVNALGVNLIL